MKRSLLGLAGALALTACSALPIPIEVDLGAYREGSETISLAEYGGQVKNLEARLRPIPLFFDPPGVAMTYAEVSAALKARVDTFPPSTGGARLALYLAPGQAGAPCEYRETYQGAYHVTSVGFAIGVETDVWMRGVLEASRNEAQLAALNRGALCLGLEVALNASEYFDGVRLAWRFTHLRVGVGIF